MDKVLMIILIILLALVKIAAVASMMQLVWMGISAAFELPALPWYTFVALSILVVGLTSTNSKSKDE